MPKDDICFNVTIIYSIILICLRLYNFYTSIFRFLVIVSVLVVFIIVMIAKIVLYDR